MSSEPLWFAFYHILFYMYTHIYTAREKEKEKGYKDTDIPQAVHD